LWRIAPQRAPLTSSTCATCTGSYRTEWQADELAVAALQLCIVTPTQCCTTAQRRGLRLASSYVPCHSTAVSYRIIAHLCLCMCVSMGVKECSATFLYFCASYFCLGRCNSLPWLSLEHPHNYVVDDFSLKSKAWHGYWGACIYVPLS